MEKNQLGMVILVAIIFIVATALIGGIADPISEYDDVITTTNESVTFSDGSLVLVHTPLITNGLAGSIITSGTNILSNSTNSTISSNNYNLYANGSLILNDGAYADLGSSSLANFTYQSYSETYISGGSTRTIAGFAILFFAIAILAVGVWYIRSYGWFGK